MDPLSLHAVEGFIKKAQIATSAKSKEVRFSLREMNEISTSLASVMTRLVILTEDNDSLMLQINQLKLQLNTGGDMNLDGGGFRE